MLELRPGCECCDRDLPPESTEARICSFECTFCRECAEGKLAGKTLVVTGTLIDYTRQQIELLIHDHGGRPASSVSKNTDYVVAGENAGSKLEKARKLGVQVITEKEFTELIQ